MRISAKTRESILDLVRRGCRLDWICAKLHVKRFTVRAAAAAAGLDVSMSSARANKICQQPPPHSWAAPAARCAHCGAAIPAGADRTTLGGRPWCPACAKRRFRVREDALGVGVSPESVDVHPVRMRIQSTSW